MDDLIAAIPKNATEEIQVELDEFKGYDLISLRIWAIPYTGDEPVPTRKGISVSIKLLPDLIVALQEAEDAAREAGLLSDDEEAA